VKRKSVGLKDRISDGLESGSVFPSKPELSHGPFSEPQFLSLFFFFLAILGFELLGLSAT
jgi:hypothetical protein